MIPQRSYRGWALLGCALLAACPGEGGGTGSASATATTTGTTGGTDDGTTTTGPATSTGEQPTSGTATGGAATSTGEASTSGPGTTGGHDPLSDCQAQYAALAAQTDHDCMCQVAAGDYPDQQTCLADYEPAPVDCLCPIFVGDPTNTGWLACVAAAETAYTACIDPLACDDGNGYAGCADTYFATLDGCGNPSKSTLGQTDVQCWKVDGFMCGSGESVPFYYACDDEPDCMDMSDESDAACKFTCGDGEKIDLDQVCDDNVDCADASDEADATCKFTCGSGEKIPKDFVCDEEPDCMDGSDEAMCLLAPLTPPATGSWSAGTRPRRGRTASPAARAAAWPRR